MDYYLFLPIIWVAYTSYLSCIFLSLSSSKVTFLLLSRYQDSSFSFSPSSRLRSGHMQIITWFNLFLTSSFPSNHSSSFTSSLLHLLSNFKLILLFFTILFLSNQLTNNVHHDSMHVNVKINLLRAFIDDFTIVSNDEQLYSIILLHLLCSFRYFRVWYYWYISMQHWWLPCRIYWLTKFWYSSRNQVV